MIHIDLVNPLLPAQITPYKIDAFTYFIKKVISTRMRKILLNCSEYITKQQGDFLMLKLLYVVVTIVITVLLARESDIIKGLDSNVKIYWLTFMVLIVPLSELNKIILDKVITLPYLPLFVHNILSSQVTIVFLGMVMLINEFNLIVVFLQRRKLRN